MDDNYNLFTRRGWRKLGLDVRRYGSPYWGWKIVMLHSFGILLCWLFGHDTFQLAGSLDKSCKRCSAALPPDYSHPGQYAWATIRHKWYVWKAGRRLKVGWWRLLIHDYTKFLPAEYPYYQRQFFGKADDPDGFARAWLHHQNSWSHHWEYHITRTAHSRGAVKPDIVDDCLPMPEMDVREMVADWMGASRAYTNSWDISGWFHGHIGKIKLHPKTRQILSKVLSEIDVKYYPEN